MNTKLLKILQDFHYELDTCDVELEGDVLELFNKLNDILDEINPLS